jgi:hypothetical protein
MTRQRSLRIKLRILNASVLFLAVVAVLAAFAGSAIAENPVPFIDQPLVPDATAPGGTGFTLTVNGAGFVSKSVVNWNGSPRATTFVSSSQLKAAILAPDIATASTATVTVVSPSPGGGVSNVQYFSIAPVELTFAFVTAVTYSSGGDNVGWVAVADVNGDGKLDLIVANQKGERNGDGSVAVLLGNGDGTFQSPVTYDSGGTSPDSLAIADVNGDGNLDIVVANSNSSTVGVLLGNGDGTFQPSVTYSCAVNAVTVAVGDVNRDGKLDVLVAGSGSVSVLLGNGDGTFQRPAIYSAGDLTGAVVVADLRGNGLLDLAITKWTGGEPNYDGSAGVLLGNGDGTFQPVVLYDAGGEETRNIAVADVNGDGKPDLLTANAEGSVGVLLGNGDGTFQTVVTYAAANLPWSIAVADVNGDGKQDAITASLSGGADVLPGNGDGTFQAAQTYSGNASSADSVAVADLNGDGRPDIVLADTASPGLVSVLLNSPGAQTTTTLNSSPNPSNYGQTVTFTATVTSISGTPTGTVLILNGSATVGSGSLANGKVSIPVSSLPGGSDSITATYQGSANFAPSSATITQVVAPDSTTTTMVSSLNPSTYGQKVTWTATVTTSGSITPTGKVNFTWDGYSIGTATLNASGVAYLSKSNLNVYTYPLIAVYARDANNVGSRSAILNQVVKETTSAATLSSSLNPSTQGQAVTFTATITSPTVTATGPVTFTAGTTVLGTAELSDHKATFTTSTLPVGSTPVTATYNGDSNIAESSASVMQTVQP